MIVYDLLNRLKNKTVWITGGRRVGQTVAAGLAELGMNILVSYRGSRKEAEAAVNYANKCRVKALAVPADISKKVDAEQAAAEGEEKLGSIHALVQMASVFKPVAWDKVVEADWEENMAVHIKGAFWPAQVLARRWRERKFAGKIIFFTDRTAPDIGRPYPDYLPYGVTKGGLQTMVKFLARELGPYGITVNAVAPGPLKRPPHIPQKEWQAIRDSALLRDITDEEAERQTALAVVYWLAAELSTGQTLLLDSGMNLQ